MAVDGFVRASQFALDGLRQCQDLEGSKGSADTEGGIEKSVFGGKAPRGSLIKRGYGGDDPYPFFYKFHGVVQVLPLIA